MSTTSSSGGLPVRQLRWPASPAVDLLQECHWLVNMDARNTNPARKPRHFEEQARHKLDLLNEIDNKELLNLSKQKSPYRQQLRRPKLPVPSPGSPAQRAAKSILKLKDGLQRLDDTKWSGGKHDIQNDTTVLAQQQTVQPVVGSTLKAVDSSLTTMSLGTRSPSPNRAKTPQRSPSRKKKKRPPTHEERELAEKQERLTTWLKTNPDTGSVEDSPTELTPFYSVEVEARIESAVQCQGSLESGVRLWDDSVRSLLAAEMTSESVFGGAVPTRALAFPSPERASPSRFSHDSPPKQPPLVTDEDIVKVHNDQESDEEVLGIVDFVVLEPQLSDHAQKVFGMAHRQVSDGSAADALATLQAGIRQSLSTSQAHLDAANGSHGVGFNYSALAHKSATKLQLYYRARHRRRINRLVLLQRQWRWWHARRRALKAVQFANKQAMMIQRRYRPWYIHVRQVRCAVRVQRFFRVFKSQKFLARFRRVCRLLIGRQARCRQVKTRMRMIGKVILLFRKRRRQIALIQGLWRRRCAQAQLKALLAQVSAIELGRRAREDEFVAAKLQQAKFHFRDFLRNTKRGCELVHWQAEKPWLRFRSLRHDTRKWCELPLSERIDAVAKLLPTRTLQGLHERGICQMLVGNDKQLPALPKVLTVSTEELAFLATPLTLSDATQYLEPVGCAYCPLSTEVREKLKGIRAKLSTLWWTIVTYPKEYCTARIWPIRKYRRNSAQQQLEDDFARILTAFLRVWFRRIDSKTNTPPYACEWCSEPFGTSHEFFAHSECAVARARAEVEWTALTNDLQFARRKKWRFLQQPHDDPVRTDNYAFDLEAASVRRLRRSRSRRKVLNLLVETLEACTAVDTPNAVIPMYLAAFVLQYLDDSKTLHPLMQTVEHQLVRWNTLIGLMQVENSNQTPEGSGLESRWIRKDDLRSRLIVGSKWGGILSRLHRNIDRCQRKTQSRGR